MGKQWLLLCVFAAATLLCACGAPKHRVRRIDKMVFADDPEEGNFEQIPTPKQRVRLQRPGVTATQVPLQLPNPKCVGNKSSPSKSIGPTTDGSLQNPCKIMSNGPGYVAGGANVFGTDQTVALLQWAAAQLVEQFPGSAPLVIGAISAENGGYLKPHKSHQSGRDVDIGYLHTTRSGLKHFEMTDAGNLDAEKTWAFLEALLTSGEVVFVFMDYNLQAEIYNALLDNGWNEAALAPMFQFPAGPKVPRGVIRHAVGHADHFHVRFRCPEKDKPDCVD